MKTNIIAWMVAACALVGTAFAKQEAKAETPYEEAVEVFSSAKSKEHKSMRIPCIVNADGLLIAAAEGRYNHGDQAQNDIVVSVSKDGKSWSDPVIAAKSDEGSTFNNPCLIYDPEKKQTLLFFQRYAKGVKERDGLPLDLKDKRALRNFVCFSKNGKKWSKPVEVTQTTRHTDCATNCSGPNPGVLLTRGPHKGRLVVAMNEAEKFGNWHITVAYSDDHGKTWNMGGKSAANHGINEVSSVETEDGGILVVSRNYGGPGGKSKRVSRSADGGETWSDVTYHNELPCVGCQNGLTRYSFKDDKKYGGKGRILFSAPAGNGRNNGVIKMSYDDGETWPVSKSVGAGAFAYSTMCPMSKPGYVGLLFESDGGNTIKFVPISLEWLTDGEDTGKEGGK